MNTPNRIQVWHLTALLAAVSLCSPAIGATVTWNAPVTIAGDSDVSTTGSLVNAFTFASGNVATVNGVNFLPFSISANTTTFGGSNSPFGTGNAPFSSLSSSYQNAITGGLFNGGGTDSVTLNNLTVGHTYQVQIWADDSRSCCSSRTETVAGNNSPTLAYNNTAAAGGVGQFVTGTFTANSTSQSISYTFFPSGTSAQVNGLQVMHLTALVANNVT